jgi:hypothetical protein
MSTGLGEYLSNGAQDLSAQELLATAQPVEGMGASPDGIGSMPMLAPAPARPMPRAVSGSVEKAIPILRDVRRVSRARSVRGLGDDAELPVVAVVGLVVLGMALRGTAGYFAGKAMAPSAHKETSYAWTGAGVAIVFGALGLGVQGIVALRSHS